MSRILRLKYLDYYGIKLIRREIVSVYEGLDENINDKLRDYLGKFVSSDKDDTNKEKTERETIW